MTVDELARRAGSQLREYVTATTSTADVEASLRSLRTVADRRTRTRNVRRGLAVAATVAAVAGAAALVDPGSDDAAEPAQPSTSSSCHGELVRCTEDGAVTVDSAVDYRVALLDGFALDTDTSAAPEEMGIYSTEHHAGVTFVVDPEAADVGVGNDAESLASWVAARPWLRADLLEASIGRQDGWRVDATLRPGPALDRARSCDGEGTGSPCRALLRTPGIAYGEFGPWSGMESRFYFVDVPGGHTLVAWSWSFDPDPAGIERNDLLVRSVQLDVDE